MKSSNFPEDNENLPPNKDSATFGPSSAKKRKLSIGESSSYLSNIEFKVLKFENNELKEGVKQMEFTISMLQKENLDLQIKYKESSKVVTKLNSNINKDAEKIKIIEDINQELEGKNKELMDEVATMKIIKLEIKDSVENERETAQENMDKLKAEINVLKNKNIDMEEINKKRLNSIETFIFKNEILKQQIKENTEIFQAEIKEKKKIFEDKIKVLNATVNEYNEKIKVLQDKNQELEGKIKERMDVSTEEQIKSLTLKDVTKNDGRINLSLLSCKQKILNCQKMEGEMLFINYYPNCDESAKAVFLGYNDYRNTCFKININGELIIRANCNSYEEIMSRISGCQLFKLHLSNQEISYNDYLQLTSSKEVKICILEKTVIKNYHVYDILNELPKLEEFQYEFRDDEEQSTIASNLGKVIHSFSSLEKFELLNLNHTFKLGEFFGFIKKNANAKVCYSLKFRKFSLKSMQKEVEKNEKVLINSLNSWTSPCNISIEYNKI